MKNWKPLVLSFAIVLIAVAGFLASASEVSAQACSASSCQVAANCTCNARVMSCKGSVVMWTFPCEADGYRWVATGCDASGCNLSGEGEQGYCDGSTGTCACSGGGGTTCSYDTTSCPTNVQRIACAYDGGNGDPGPGPVTGAECTSTTGNNKMTGCVFNNTDLTSTAGNAPEGPSVPSPADRDVVVLDFDGSVLSAREDQWKCNWVDDGKGGQEEVCGWENVCIGPAGLCDDYSILWKGIFNFSGGEYYISSHAREGYRVIICDTNNTNCSTVVDRWSGGAAPDFRGANITPGQHLVKVEYKTFYSGANVFLKWNLIVPLRPDLTAGSVTPSTATAGTPLTFSATVTNSGTAGTGGTAFPNVFQIATDSSGGGAAFIGGAKNVSSNVAVGGNVVVTSDSYSPPILGGSSYDRWVRFCADNNLSWTGTITEVNEVNNCSNWTRVTVNPPASVVADLKFTQWAAWDGSGRDNPFVYTDSDGPGVLYAGAPYKLSWTSANSSSCTLDAGAVALNGSNNTYNAGGVGGGSWTRTHTLTCTNGATSRTDTVVVSVPPGPTGPIGSCNAAGTTGSFSWTKAPGYTHNYIRACELVGGLGTACVDPNTVMATLPPDTENYAGSSASFPTTVNKSYSWWVHTKDPSSGMWSDVVSGSFTCTAAAAPTPPVCGIPALANRTIVSFDTSVPMSNARQFTEYRPITLPAGNYNVTLHSWDGYINRDTTNPNPPNSQLDETWRVMFLDTGGSVIENVSGEWLMTAKSNDLADWVEQDSNIDLLSGIFNLPTAAAQARGVHGPYPDITQPNSLRPICAAFDRLVDPIDLTFTGGNVILPAQPTLTWWTSGNPDSCTATGPGGWTGSKSTSGGSQTLSGLAAGNYTFDLTCIKAGTGSVNRQVTVNVSAPVDCKINLTKGGYGVITSTPGGINCGTSCNSQEGTFTCGDDVVLIPSFSSTQKFVGWGGDCAGQPLTGCTFNDISGDKNVTAIFTINPIFIEF